MTDRQLDTEIIDQVEKWKAERLDKNRSCTRKAVKKNRIRSMQQHAGYAFFVIGLVTMFIGTTLADLSQSGAALPVFFMGFIIGAIGTVMVSYTDMQRGL